MRPIALTRNTGGQMMRVLLIVVLLIGWSGSAMGDKLNRFRADKTDDGADQSCGNPRYVAIFGL